MLKRFLRLGILIPVATSLDERYKGQHGFQVGPMERSTDDSMEVDRAITNQNGQSLGGGRYITTTDVGAIFELGNDIAAMEKIQNVTEIKKIYRNGNSGESIEIGDDGNITSLASLSLELTQWMMDDPSFVIYRHAFKGIGTQHGEEEGHYGVQPAEFYADTLFLDLIDRNILGIQGEVALILHVWMAISHELNAVWIHCDSKYNPVETLTSLDRAVALWVGERDETSNGGHLLYHLAELAGNFFQKETEKNWVNTQIMKSFSSIQSKISTGALCSEAANRTGLHAEIDRIHSLMMVPLLQNLIHYVMAGEKKELAKIYLAAVLPHVLACDPNMAMELDLVGTIGSLNDTQKIAWVRSLHKAFSCMRLACDDIGAYTQDPNYPDCRDDLTANFTSHVASNPKSELYSRIDRDLQRLQILLNEGAYKSALTLYVHGYHAPFSLQKLAANDVIPRPVGPLVDLYKYVYGNDDDDPKYFADQEVQRAINREGEFRSLPDEELTDLVLGLLTYEVSFFAVMSSFDISQEMCEDNGSNTTALEYWDNGAALYVGSIEGSNKGGKIGGQLLYGVSKTLCSLFKTCFEGNSRANHLMIQSLALGAEYLAEGKCTALGNLIEDFIYPALQTIVIQGTLASVATVSSSEGTRSNVTGLGSVHAFARSLLPQLREARKEIAPQVEQKLLLPYSEALSMSAIYDVAEVLYLAMPDLATDCESVGTMKSPSLTLCQTIRLQNPINDISFGRYLFLDTDIVDHLAAIALDIRDMRNATSIEQAIEIYQQGRHALQDSRGRITLASFSTNATVWMADDPIFNMYKFALYDKSALASRDVPFPFADDFVQKTTDLKLIPDAAVVLNVWMMISHHLSQVWRTCADKKDATKEVDAAVALWIGNDQVEGSYETGWLVYSVVQDASRTFGHPEKEAKLNENLMKGFNHLQRISQECVDNDNTTTLLQDLRYHLFEVQRLLTIPLLQLLLSAIAEKDSSRVELFATSVIPLSVGCNRKIYSDLSQRLLRDFQAWNDEGISDLKVFLECLDVSCEELNVTTTASESLQDLMEKFCAAKGPHNEVSADPLFKAVSRIDLDILQIEILLRTEANGAAMDLYNYGRNTNILNLDLPGQMEGSSFLSLHHLATLSANTSLLKEFEEYYGSTNYADELVTELIQQEGLYQNATSSLLAADNSALQLLILFQGILWNLQEAVTSCEKGQMTSAIKGWLVAMGIFNGSTSDSSVHSLGSQICAGFGTCTDDGDSLSNQVILGALQQGYVSLKANECLLAQELMDSTIIPLLKVPLIQATLERSVVHEDTVTNATEERHASGFAVTQAILPFLANVNTDSAEVIANIFRSPSDIASSWEETDLVFKAIQYVLPAMGIECSYLGSWVDEPSLSFCFDLNLTDWIIPHSDLGLDVRDMRAALRSGEVELARMIYNDGKNGKVGNHTLSLRSLSTEATMEMAGVPLFELFLHTHSGSQRYADSFVQEAFKLAGSTNTEVARSAVVASTIAAEATIVLHLWMAVIYQMHRAVLACENSGSLNDIAEAIDRTTAYYIGDAQPNNEAEPGHLLYGWTQEMSSHFASVGENVLGVNEYILILFAEAHEMIGGLSTSNSRGAFELNALFHEATLQMTIPLVQGLLHALMMDDRERVRLYSHAVVPLFSSCDRGDYEYFQRTLMDTSFVATEIQAIVDRVYQLLPCLGLTCSQVGLHQLDMAASYTRPFCSEDSLKKSYHGYQPSNDKVFEDFGRIDQDLREISIFLETEAYEAAEQIYKYGRHSESSLRSMARSLIVLSNDTSALQLFSEYFSDDMYIDTLVSDAIVDGFFRDNAIEMELSAVERRVLAVGFSQMVLLPHAAFVCMREALSQCRNGGSDHDSGLVAWDRAAAFLLGSGHLSPYDLGQTHCAKFGTCALETGVAESNRMMVDLLYAGRGALTQHNASHSLQCEVLVKLSKEIQALVWVPIFQAALQSTLQVSRSANAEVAALAFVSSRAVLPLIHDLDPKAALKLKKLLPLKTAKFDASTGVLVMDSFSRFYDDLNIDCDWIGQIGEYHPCQSNNSDQFENAAQDLSTGAVASIILVTLLAAVAAFCYWRRNRHRRRSQSDNSLSGHVAATSSKDQDDDHLSSNTSSVDKALGSDSTMDTFDPNLINKSFRSSGSQLSSKANRTLTRITSYGDDSEKVLEEDSILRKRQSPKETGSSTVISKEDHEMDII